MKAWLLKYWDTLRSSFWFLPSLMAGAAFGLAFGTVALDELVGDQWLQEQGWAYTGGAEGASLVLGTIAGSMITIAGVVFSMTLVSLSLASSQLGPRLLRNFMRDTMNQVVLGTFVATFVYCLLVLRTIRLAEDNLFVPHLSVTVGVMFALVSLAVLIYFIHHVSISIQADEVISRVGGELIQGIDRLFPEQIGHSKSSTGVADSGAHVPDAFAGEGCPIPAAGDGYLQIVDADALLELATREHLVLRLEFRPGHYIIEGRPLLMLWPGTRCTDQITTEVNSAFIVGNQRTSAQDIEFAVEQLVEVAARALSPGINDPFTAIRCVDRLGSALWRLAQRDLPSPYRFDAQGRLRLIAPGPTFIDVMDASFNQIRRYARSSAAVTIRLLESIALLAGAVRRPEDRTALRRHADMIIRGAREALPEIEDRRAVEERYLAAMREMPEAGESHD